MHVVVIFFQQYLPNLGITFTAHCKTMTQTECSRFDDFKEDQRNNLEMQK